MKAFIVTIDDGEEKILNRILSVLNNEQIVCQSIPKIKCSRLNFRGFAIDLDRRRVEKEGADVNLRSRNLRYCDFWHRSQGWCSARNRFIMRSGRSHMPGITAM